MQKYHKFRNIASIAGLMFFIFLASGSFSNEVTVDTINKAKKTLSKDLHKVNKATEKTTGEVDTAYEQLKTFLHQQNLTDSNLRILESRLDTVREKYDNLESAFNDSKSNAENLFDMLEKRAKENKTKELRKKMLRDIDTKNEALEGKMDAAEQLMEKIYKSIQKYDDIVGYCQVNKGLEGVNSIIDDIKSTMQDGAMLNEEIQGFVKEGLKIIESIDQ